MILTDFIAHAETRLETLLNQYLSDDSFPAPGLQKAAAYATLNGGKRTRPLLVYLTGRLFNASFEDLDAAACAIELIHVYSLIHDDLPAMDNADLRRGKPSCHKAFNEAIAILAGDALQPMAFDIIARHPSGLTAEQRLNMIKVLSEASGMRGMAAGQMMDMEGVSSADELIQMYRLKTGALLSASVRLGALSAGISDSATLGALNRFAENMGLAFQIQDDLLDIEKPSDLTGKPQGIDQTNGKITWPSLVGIQASQEKVEVLFDEGIQSLDLLAGKNNLLSQFATQLMQRNK